MSKNVESVLKERGKWGMRLGLERIEALLEELTNPEKKLKIVHVAGSNGKGSTVKLLESILIKSGIRVGAFTSPAIEDDRDRIRLNGEMIDEKTLERLFETVESAAERLKEKTGEEATGFELETAIAFLYFFEKDVDLALIEVGLGGRLDATNVVKNPLVDVITHISLEHTEYLGDTIEKIAAEKGAIIKDGAYLVVAPQEKKAKEELLKKVRGKKLKGVRFLDEGEVRIIESSLDSQRVKIGGETYNLSLLGNFQGTNLLTALAVVDFLRLEGFKIEKEDIKRALENVSFPGRFERINESPDIIIDGAHNLDGMTRLVESLDTFFDKETFIFGMLEEKDVSSVLNLILPRAKRIYLIEPDSPLAIKSETLKREIEERTSDVPTKILTSPEELFSKIDFKEKDPYVITGSLYLISKLRPALKSFLNSRRA